MIVLPKSIHIHLQYPCLIFLDLGSVVDQLTTLALTLSSNFLICLISNLFFQINPASQKKNFTRAMAYTCYLQKETFGADKC